MRHYSAIPDPSLDRTKISLKAMLRALRAEGQGMNQIEEEGMMAEEAAIPTH